MDIKITNTQIETDSNVIKVIKFVDVSIEKDQIVVVVNNMRKVFIGKEDNLYINGALITGTLADKVKSFPDDFFVEAPGEGGGGYGITPLYTEDAIEKPDGNSVYRAMESGTFTLPVTSGTQSITVSADEVSVGGDIDRLELRYNAGQDLWSKVAIEKPSGVKRPKKNYYDDSKKVSGKNINTSTGIIGATASGIITDYILVYPGEQYILSGIPPTNFSVNKNTFWCAFYDKDKNYVPGSIKVIQLGRYVTVPVGSKYMVAQLMYGGSTSITSSVMIERQTQVTEYQAYALNDYADVLASDRVSKSDFKYYPSKNMISQQGLLQAVQSTNSPYSIVVGDASRITSGFIEIDDGKQYVYSAPIYNYATSQPPWFGFYDADFSFIQTSAGVLIAPVGFESYYVSKITPPVGSKYILIQVAYNGTSIDLNSIQLEEGTTPTVHEDFQTTKSLVAIDDGVVKKSTVSVVSGAYINLFDRDSIRSGVINTGTPGVISTNANSRISDYIPVASGSMYTYKFKTANLSINTDGWALFYDNTKSYISSYFSRGFSISSGDYTLVFMKVPEEASYIVVQCSYNNHNTADYGTVSLIKGIGNFEYIPYKKVISSVDDYIHFYSSPDIVKASGAYYNKKFVFLGDSITYQNKWQPTLQNRFGFVYSFREIQYGLDGKKPTGVGGSMVTPLIIDETGKRTGESIYVRADDVQYYSPDVIIVLGGQNDRIATGDVPLGSISDATYTGGEVTSGSPSFYASYKGLLTKLITQNPTSQIICIAPMFSTDQTWAQKKDKADAVIACAKSFGIKCINGLEDFGINSINQSSYFSDGVHPSDVGGKRIADIISAYL